MYNLTEEEKKLLISYCYNQADKCEKNEALWDCIYWYCDIANKIREDIKLEVDEKQMLINYCNETIQFLDFISEEVNDPGIELAIQDYIEIRNKLQGVI